jgi:hypothetical protein
MRFGRLLSTLNMQAWPENVLHLVNSAANVTSIIGAAVVLISVALIYFSGTELARRAKQKSQTPGQDQAKTSRLSEAKTDRAAARKSEEAKARLSETEAKLAAARKSEKEKASRLSQTEAELVVTRRSEEAKAFRVTQTEAELVVARRAEKEKALRLSQMEAELSAVRRSQEATASRLAQAEAELAAARRSAEEAKGLVKRLEEKQRPRTITPEQRSQFLNAVRGQPKGKVIVSAIFFNKETHDVGAEMLSLLKEAGFDVIEPAPLNFFTTSRPPSGVRIGVRNESDAPPQVVTVLKGLSAMGLDPPTTTLVNAQEDDVVEIQVTPKE